MNYSFYTFYQKEILFGFFQMFIINKYTHVIPVYFNDVVINFKGGGGGWKKIRSALKKK